MITRQTTAFSIPFSILEKLPDLALWMYKKGFIEKPTASETVSKALAVMMNDMEDYPLREKTVKKGRKRGLETRGT